MGIFDLFKKKGFASGKTRAVAKSDLVELYLQITAATKALKELCDRNGIKPGADFETKCLRILGNVQQAADSMPDGIGLLMRTDGMAGQYAKAYLSGACFLKDERIGSWPEYFSKFGGKKSESSWKGGDPKADEPAFKAWVQARATENYGLLETWAGLYSRTVGDLPGVRL